MVKRFLRIACSILTLFFTGICFTTAISADKSLPQDRKAYLKSLGLDRNYHKCISVADGDTITLEGLGTVRLIGVDTPEKNHPKLPVQYWSRKAGTFTEALCLGKMVRLDYDFSGKDLRGNYGRLLGYAYLQDGTFLQEALIKNGHGIAYTKYPFDQDKKEKFLDWERLARDRGVGLWRNEGLAEVNWILSQGHPLIRLGPVEDGAWDIIFGNWKSVRVPRGKLERRLAGLYASIYEFSARDLQTWLVEHGYHQTVQNESSGDSIFVIGMANRKWGIIYDKFARPRIEQGGLDQALEMLKVQVSRTDPEKPVFTQADAGFLKLRSKVPGSEARNRIALKFLTPDVIASNNQAIIPWDRAGDHVGDHMTIEGRITRTFNSGKACFLNFHHNWTRYFSLVIFENVFHRFPEKPEDYYLNQRIRVRGKIKSFKGRPEMIVNHPNQIKIIDR